MDTADVLFVKLPLRVIAAVPAELTTWRAVEYTKRTLTGNYLNRPTLKSWSVFLHILAKQQDISPGYLATVFKKETGITIGQYINSEKIRLISELMNNKGLSFRLACESVGIADVSYGYRLFKKQMGLTPGEYKETSIIKKNFMKKGNTNENH